MNARPRTAVRLARRERRMSARPLAALALLTATLAAPAAAHAAAASEQLMLDVHDATPREQPTVVAANALEAGRAYVITVTGTYSIVPADRWTHPAICGRPLAGPRFVSPGVVNGRVGLDAELQFARTADQGCSGAFPRSHNRFQIDVGSGFRHVPAEGAPFATPTGGTPLDTRDDGYQYRVTGTGATPRFRVWDDPAADDYGQLRIVIAPAQPDVPAPSGAAGSAPPPSAQPAPHAAGRCVVRRVLHLQLGAGSVIAHARVTVDGWRWGRVRYGRRVTARLDLRHVTHDRVRVRVRILTRDGRLLRRARTYGTCARRAAAARAAGHSYARPHGRHSDETA
jgi:hypothetical protein